MFFAPPYGKLCQKLKTFKNPFDKSYLLKSADATTGGLYLLIELVRHL